MRVNARLDKEAEEKIRFLEEHTGASRSEVLRAALLLYYDQVRLQHDPRHALRDSGFIGCAEGPQDLSARYKDHLTDALDTKHGDS